jgi:hypothetical protein
MRDKVKISGIKGIKLSFIPRIVLKTKIPIINLKLFVPSAIKSIKVIMNKNNAEETPFLPNVMRIDSMMVSMKFRSS